MNRKMLLAALGLMATVGCSGTELPLGEAPGGASQGGSAGASGGSTGGSGGLLASGSGLEACESQCFRAILNLTGSGCKTCHGAAVKLAGTLDLESPGISQRLKDKPAEHAGVPAGTLCPTGDKLIDSAHPENSWLLAKIAGQQGQCGTVMPSTGALPPEGVRCFQDYVNCVASH